MYLPKYVCAPSSTALCDNIEREVSFIFHGRHCERFQPFSTRELDLPSSAVDDSALISCIDGVKRSFGPSNYAVANSFLSNNVFRLARTDHLPKRGYDRLSALHLGEASAISTERHSEGNPVFL